MEDNYQDGGVIPSNDLYQKVLGKGEWGNEKEVTSFTPTNPDLVPDSQIFDYVSERSYLKSQLEMAKTNADINKKIPLFSVWNGNPPDLAEAQRGLLKGRTKGSLIEQLALNPQLLEQIQKNNVAYNIPESLGTEEKYIEFRKQQLQQQNQQQLNQEQNSFIKGYKEQQLNQEQINQFKKEYKAISNQYKEMALNQYFLSKVPAYVDLGRGRRGIDGTTSVTELNGVKKAGITIPNPVKLPLYDVKKKNETDNRYLYRTRGFKDELNKTYYAPKGISKEGLEDIKKNNPNFKIEEYDPDSNLAYGYYMWNKGIVWDKDAQGNVSLRTLRKGEEDYNSIGNLTLGIDDIRTDYGLGTFLLNGITSLYDGIYTMAKGRFDLVKLGVGLGHDLASLVTGNDYSSYDKRTKLWSVVNESNRILNLFKANNIRNEVDGNDPQNFGQQLHYWQNGINSVLGQGIGAIATGGTSLISKGANILSNVALPNAIINLNKYGLTQLQKAVPAISKQIDVITKAGGISPATGRLLAGAALYWDEGNKMAYQSGFKNPELVSLPLFGVGILTSRFDDFLLGKDSSGGLIRWLGSKTGLASTADLQRSIIKEELKSLKNVSGLTAEAQAVLIDNIKTSSYRKSINQLADNYLAKSVVEGFTEGAEEVAKGSYAMLYNNIAETIDSNAKKFNKEFAKIDWGEAFEAGVFSFIGTSILGRLAGKHKGQKGSDKNDLLNLISNNKEYDKFIAVLEKEASGENMGLFFPNGLKYDATKKDFVPIEDKSEISANQRLASVLLEQTKTLKQIYDGFKANIKKESGKNLSKYQLDEVTKKLIEEGSFDNYFDHLVKKSFDDNMTNKTNISIDELESTLDPFVKKEKETDVEKTKREEFINKFNRDYIEYALYKTTVKASKLEDYIAYRTLNSKIKNKHFNTVKDNLEQINKAFNTEYKNKIEEIQNDTNLTNDEKIQKVQKLRDDLKNKINKGLVKYNTAQVSEVIDEINNDFSQQISDISKEITNLSTELDEKKISLQAIEEQLVELEESKEIEGVDLQDIQDKINKYEEYKSLIEKRINTINSQISNLTELGKKISLDKTNFENRVGALKPIKTQKDLVDALSEIQNDIYFGIEYSTESDADKNLSTTDILSYVKNLKEQDLSLGQINKEYQLLSQMVNRLGFLAKVNHSISKKFNDIFNKDADTLTSEDVLPVISEKQYRIENDKPTGEFVDYIEQIEKELKELLDIIVEKEGSAIKKSITAGYAVMQERFEILSRYVNNTSQEIKDQLEKLKEDLTVLKTQLDTVAIVKTDTNVKGDGFTIDNNSLTAIRDLEKKAFTSMQNLQDSIYADKSNPILQNYIDSLQITINMDNERVSTILKTLLYLSNISQNSSIAVMQDLKGVVETDIAPSIEQMFAIEQAVLFTKNKIYQQKAKDLFKDYLSVTKNGVHFYAITNGEANPLNAIKLNGANGTGKSKLFTWFSKIVKDAYYTAPDSKQIENLKNIVHNNKNVKQLKELIDELMVLPETEERIVVLDEYTLLQGKNLDTTTKTFDNPKPTDINQMYAESTHFAVLELMSKKPNIKFILIGDEFQSTIGEKSKSNTLHIPTISNLEVQQRGGVVTIRKITDAIRTKITNLKTNNKADLLDTDLVTINYEGLYDPKTGENKGVLVLTDEAEYNKRFNEFYAKDNTTIKIGDIKDPAKKQDTIFTIQGRESDVVFIDMRHKDIRSIRGSLGLAPDVTDQEVVERHFRNLLSSFGRAKRTVVVLQNANASDNYIKMNNTTAQVVEFVEKQEDKQSQINHLKNILNDLQDPSPKMIDWKAFIDSKINMFENDEKLEIEDFLSTQKGNKKETDIITKTEQENIEKQLIPKTEINTKVVNFAKRDFIVVNEKIYEITNIFKAGVEYVKYIDENGKTKIVTADMVHFIKEENNDLHTFSKGDNNFKTAKNKKINDLQNELKNNNLKIAINNLCNITKP